MAALSEKTMEGLLRPYLQAPIPEDFVVAGQATWTALEVLLPVLSVYLDLLLRWNERTNLTAIRDPEQIVQRHFGESLFAARVLASKLRDGAIVLDIGSGAGFPGLPLQLALPGLRVTLAESQGKKSAFLREAVRATGARAEVWPARAQDLSADRLFEAITMRAVDRPEQALAEAQTRLAEGGYLLQLCGADQASQGAIPLPGRRSGFVQLAQRGSAMETTVPS